MGIILYIIAVIMFWILSPLFLLFAIINVTNHSKYFRNVALSIDQLGNTMGGPLMNMFLLKEESTHKFGNPDETISFCLGVNKLNNTLNKLGLFIANKLNKIDKNHVENAVKNNN